jgi:hypothetical protein
MSQTRGEHRDTLLNTDKVTLVLEFGHDGNSKQKQRRGIETRLS